MPREKLQDANGLVTVMTYDDFGRRLNTTYPDGNQTQYRYDYCGAQGTNSGTVSATGLPACPTGAVLRMAEVPTNAAGTVNGATKVVFYDAQSREIQSQQLQFATKGAAARWSTVTTEYDPLGRVSRKSEPYFAGDAATLTTFGYDALGRVTSESKPNPNAPGGVATLSHVYSPRKVVSTNARGHRLTTATRIRSTIR